MNTAAPFDTLETRSDSERENTLFAALREQIAHAKAGSPYWGKALADIDPDDVTDRAVLAGLPLLRKGELIELQETDPPLGGLSTTPPGLMGHLFLSPGPIAEPEGPLGANGGPSQWRMERALHAAGFRPGDRVANCFSYHLTPAGFLFDRACAALGCAVFPGGVGNTDTQVAAFNRLGLNGYVGTPDFLSVILDKADALGTPITGVSKAMVTGGPLFPSLRETYTERGISVRQCYGTAELGLVAYETGDPAAGMALDEHCIVEIVRTGTGEPVEEGEVGEVVVTTFEPHYPLIRFATGDLSAYAPTVTDEAGRTARRLRGWMGRADQTTKVRGMFVHPRQVQAAIAGFSEIPRARLEVGETGGRDTARLLCETKSDPAPGLADKLADAARGECGVRVDVLFVLPGELPNDGKVIDDQRAAPPAV